jgi:hypothetical protein
MDISGHFCTQPGGLPVVHSPGSISHPDGGSTPRDVYADAGSLGNGHAFGDRYPANAHRGSSHGNAHNQPDPDQPEV